MSKKLTKEEFIGKYNKKYPDNPLDFSKAEYKGNKIPITVRCIKHNVWYEKTPDQLLGNGNKCPMCKEESKRTTIKKNFENGKRAFESFLNLNFPKELWEYNIGDYKGCYELFKIKNRINGEIINKTPTEFKESIKTSKDRHIDREQELISLIVNYDPNIDTSLVEYTYYNKPVTLSCKNHPGVTFSYTPETIKRRIEKKLLLCPECEKEKQNKDYKEWYIKEYFNRNPENIGKYDLSKIEITTLHDTITVHCNVHDLDFKVGSFVFLNNTQYCPECTKLDTSEHLRKKNEKEFLDYMSVNFPNIDTSKVKYVNKDTKVQLTCLLHPDEDFWASPWDIKLGYPRIGWSSPCPFCREEERKNKMKQDFIDKVTKLEGNKKFDFSEIIYTNYSTPIENIRCLECGEVFSALPMHFITDTAICPGCDKYHHRTLGEQNIEIWIEKRNIKDYRIQQSISPDDLSYLCKNQKVVIIDCIINYNNNCYWIEYNGDQHYEYPNIFHKTLESFEKQVIRDECIRKHCKKNGIILIEIPPKYTALGKISNLLDEIILNNKLPQDIIELPEIMSYNEIINSFNFNKL